MSTHEIAIVEVGEIKSHPDPTVERLELTEVWGWQVCIQKGQFKPGDKMIYIPPDYLVPLDHPSFAFLKRDGDDKTQERIRVRRFKGALSQGLPISVPPELADLPVGSNVIEQLRIERYEPPLPKQTGGDFVGGPSGLYAPKFDVESYQRYRECFTNGEEIIATEKLHGANARFVWAQDKDGEWKQFCGSRTNWMAESDKIIWWMALNQCPDIGRWCQDHPNIILYGEVFGQVQSLKYGAGKNDIFFAAFGILDKNNWLDFDVARPMLDGYDVQWAPVVYRGPFDEAKLLEIAEGDSRWACEYNGKYVKADHMREGIVVVPLHERTDPNLGRVCLKMVSNRYLEKGK